LQRLLFIGILRIPVIRRGLSGIWESLSVPKLLEQARDAIRIRHYSIRTEQSYLGWMKHFILFPKRCSNIRSPWLDNIQLAKKPTRLPLVFTREEVRAILIHLEGSKWIVGALLYGAGLRLLECLRLRVKDIDFGYKQITVRDGKGAKDRITTMIYTHVLNKGGKGVRSPIDQF
jgi:site-specific recombinase XerD